VSTAQLTQQVVPSVVPVVQQVIQQVVHVQHQPHQPVLAVPGDITPAVNAIPKL